MKTLTAFAVAVMAAIFGFGSSRALSVETKTLPEQKIQERLTTVRKQLKTQKRQIIAEKDEKTEEPPKTPVPSPWSDTR